MFETSFLQSNDAGYRLLCQASRDQTLLTLAVSEAIGSSRANRSLSKKPNSHSSANPIWIAPAQTDRRLLGWRNGWDGGRRCRLFTRTNGIHHRRGAAVFCPACGCSLRQGHIKRHDDTQNDRQETRGNRHSSSLNPSRISSVRIASHCIVSCPSAQAMPGRVDK